MAAGDPTGIDLCSGTIEAGDLTISYLDDETVEITFDSSVELVSSTQYAIVVRTETDEDNPVSWGQFTENTYDDGFRCYSYDAGETWTQYSTRDNYFATKASGVVKDFNPSDPDDIASELEFYGDRWSAQTFTASSTYTITSVVLALWKDNAGTTGTVTVSIRATSAAPGVPTLVSPTPTGVTDITLDETPLEWAAGDPAGDTYEIYFREQGDDWELVGEAQAGVEWAVEFGTLDYNTTYEWRVDATNDVDTTTGDTWSFTTISFNRILISYDLITGGSGAGPYDDPPGVEGTDWRWTGENNMLAVRRLIVAVEDKIWYEDL